MGVKVLVQMPALVDTDEEEEMKDIHDLHAPRADVGLMNVRTDAGRIDDDILAANLVQMTLVSSVCLGAKRQRTSRALGGRM